MNWPPLTNVDHSRLVSTTLVMHHFASTTGDTTTYNCIPLKISPIWLRSSTTVNNGQCRMSSTTGVDRSQCRSTDFLLGLITKPVGFRFRSLPFSFLADTVSRNRTFAHHVGLPLAEGLEMITRYMRRHLLCWITCITSKHPHFITWSSTILG